MTRESLFQNLSAPQKENIAREFELSVENAEGEQYEKPFAGLTKDEILASQSLRHFWTYWYCSVPYYDRREHGLQYWPELSIKRSELASQKLNMLTYVLWKIAQVAEDGVGLEVDQINSVKDSLMSTAVGQAAQGVEHLRAAAKCFGLQPDHFIRSVRVSEIRRLEGELENEYEIRKGAVEAHRLMQGLQFVDSDRQPPSLATYALRRIWPMLDIDVPTLKRLFLTEKGAHRHAAALRSILMMSSTDFKKSLTTGYFDQFLRSIESSR